MSIVHSSLQVRSVEDRQVEVLARGLFRSSIQLTSFHEDPGGKSREMESEIAREDSTSPEKTISNCDYNKHL